MQSESFDSQPPAGFAEPAPLGISESGVAAPGGAARAPGKVHPVNHAVFEKLEASLEDLLNRHAGTRLNGNTASLRTQVLTRETLLQCCKRLHRLGFFIQDIHSLSDKHVAALVQDWHSGGTTGKPLGVKTMQNHLSRLRMAARWIGKPNLVRAGVPAYLPDVPAASLKVSTIATRTKSWSGNQIDLAAKLQEAKAVDERFYAMLALGVGFGLRLKEMLSVQPWKADAGNALNLVGAVTKNGRSRSIPIEVSTPLGQFQRQALDYAKNLCRLKGEHLGWTLDHLPASRARAGRAAPSLMQRNRSRFYRLMSKIGISRELVGVTTHGLRAEFAENVLLSHGVLPATLGGDLRGVGTFTLRTAETYAQSWLGHNDGHTSASYYGQLSATVPRTAVRPPTDLGLIIDCLPVPGDATATVQLDALLNLAVIQRAGSHAARRAIAAQLARRMESNCCWVVVRDARGQAQPTGSAADFLREHPQHRERLTRQLVVAIDAVLASVGAPGSCAPGAQP